MSATYGLNLATLRREIETHGARPAIIDGAVSKILAEGDRRAAHDLLLLLSDSAEYDEGMFSLIHAAESFDDRAYVRALLSVFPQLVSSAPRWASVVLMRVLNNDTAQRELVKQLCETSGTIKESVREMCRRISDVSPQFLSKTVPVVSAAG